MFHIKQDRKIISYNKAWHFLVLPKDMKHCLVVLIENTGPEIDTYSCNLIVYGCSYILSAIPRCGARRGKRKCVLMAQGAMRWGLLHCASNSGASVPQPLSVLGA